MDKSVPAGAAILLDFISARRRAWRRLSTTKVIYGNNQNKLKKPVVSMTLAELEAKQASWSKRSATRRQARRNS